MRRQSSEIQTGHTARLSLRDGVAELVEAASTTMGPRGKRFLLEATNGLPESTCQGAQVVSRLVEGEGSVNRILAHEANRMVRDFGDGSTTFLVLVGAMVREGVKWIEAGHAPRSTTDELKRATRKVVRLLASQAESITEPAQVQKAVGSFCDREDGRRLITEAVRESKDVYGVLLQESHSQDSLVTRLPPGSVDGKRRVLIWVGGSSDEDKAAKLESMRVGLRKLRLAADGGVVPGGGLAFLDISKEVAVWPADAKVSQPAIAILLAALAEPARRISDNTGLDGLAIVEKLLRDTSGAFDAMSGTYVPRVEFTVVDPVKILSQALVRAASVASSYLCSDLKLKS